MTNLLRSELFRVRKRPQSWWLLAVLVALEVMLYGIMVIVNFASSDPTSVKTNIQLPQIYDTGLVIVALAGTILAIIFASSTLGSEYGWNTLRPLLAPGPFSFGSEPRSTSSPPSGFICISKSSLSASRLSSDSLLSGGGLFLPESGDESLLDDGDLGAESLAELPPLMTALPGPLKSSAISSCSFCCRPRTSLLTRF